MNALTVATIQGHLDIVRILLDAGANPHSSVGGGRTALDYAVERGHTEIADILRSRMNRR